MPTRPEAIFDLLVDWIRPLWDYIAVFNPPPEPFEETEVEEEEGYRHCLPRGYVPDKTIEEWIVWAIKMPILKKEKAYVHSYNLISMCFCNWETMFWETVLKLFPDVDDATLQSIDTTSDRLN